MFSIVSKALGTDLAAANNYVDLCRVQRFFISILGFVKCLEQMCSFIVDPSTSTVFFLFLLAFIGILSLSVFFWEIK